MRNASAALKAFLATAKQYALVELYTLTLSDGTILRYSAGEGDITYGGNTYSRSGLNFTRGQISVSLGFQVSSFDVLVTADPDATDAQIVSTPFGSYARQGGFDGAYLQLDWLIMPTWGDTSLGLVTMFYGLISDAKFGRSGTTLTIDALTKRLNRKMPYRLYQPGCIHTLYDAGCTLSRAVFAITGTILAGTTSLVVSGTLATAKEDGYFDLGVIEFTSGALNGTTATIQSQVGSTFTLSYPLLSAPVAGVTFKVYPGCDKRQVTCGGTPKTFSADAATDTLTFTSAPLFDENEAVRFSSTGTLPAPLVAGTTYYTKNVDTLTTQLSATSNGPLLNLTTAGTGIHSIRAVGKFDNIANFEGTPFVPVVETAH